MAERNREPETRGAVEELFEPMLGDLDDSDFDDFVPLSVNRRRLAEKRRKAEKRLEEKRLRDELGYYDLDLDDF